MRLHIGCAASIVLVASACGGSSPTTTSAKPSITSAPAAATPAGPDLEVSFTAGDAPMNPTVAFGSLWVVAHHGDAVLRVDPVSGKTLARISTGDIPGGIAAGGGLLWVTHYGETQSLVAVDPATNKVVRRFALPGESCCTPVTLGRTVWVTSLVDDEPGLVAVDSTTGRIGVRAPGVDDPLVVGTQLWASQGGWPARIDPATGAVTLTSAGRGNAMSTGLPVGGLTWAAHDGVAVGLDAEGAVQRTVRGPKDVPLYYGDGGMAATSGDRVWITSGTELWTFQADDKTATAAGKIPPESTVSLAGDGEGGIWVMLFDHDKALHYAG